MSKGLADFLSEKTNGAVETVRKSIPVNMRTFVGTLANDTSPINESNFSEEDLNALSNIYQNTKNKRKLELEGIEDTIEHYASGKNGPIVWKRIDGKLVDRSKEHIAGLQKRATNLRSSTFPITYKDYRTVGQDAGWLKQMYSSFTDPNYRIGTTLGQFRASEDDKGNVVLKDTYDWTSPEDVSAKDFIKAIPEAISSPETLGNLAVRGFRPKAARPVSIRLPNRSN